MRTSNDPVAARRAHIAEALTVPTRTSTTKPTRAEFVAILRREFPLAAFESYARGLRIVAPAPVAVALATAVEGLGLTYREFVPTAWREGVQYVRVQVHGFRRTPRGGAR